MGKFRAMVVAVVSGLFLTACGQAMPFTTQQTVILADQAECIKLCQDQGGSVEQCHETCLTAGQGKACAKACAEGSTTVLQVQAVPGGCDCAACPAGVGCGEGCAKACAASQES